MTEMRFCASRGNQVRPQWGPVIERQRIWGGGNALWPQRGSVHREPTGNGRNGALCIARQPVGVAVPCNGHNRILFINNWDGKGVPHYGRMHRAPVHPTPTRLGWGVPRYSRNKILCIARQLARVEGTMRGRIGYCTPRGNMLGVRVSRGSNRHYVLRARHNNARGLLSTKLATTLSRIRWPPTTPHTLQWG